MSQSKHERSVMIRVSGRVQGVGFRFFTHQQAKKLNLTGYVKNLDDGDVQIVASGSDDAITHLIDWLTHGGPASARITSYALNEIDSAEQYVSFSVRY